MLLFYNSLKTFLQQNTENYILDSELMIFFKSIDVQNKGFVNYYEFMNVFFQSGRLKFPLNFSKNEKTPEKTADFSGEKASIFIEKKTISFSEKKTMNFSYEKKLDFSLEKNSSFSPEKNRNFSSEKTKNSSEKMRAILKENNSSTEKSCEKKKNETFYNNSSYSQKKSLNYDIFKPINIQSLLFYRKEEFSSQKFEEFKGKFNEKFNEKLNGNFKEKTDEKNRGNFKEKTDEKNKGNFNEKLNEKNNGDFNEKFNGNFNGNFNENFNEKPDEEKKDTFRKHRFSNSIERKKNERLYTPKKPLNINYCQTSKLFSQTPTMNSINSKKNERFIHDNHEKKFVFSQEKLNKKNDFPGKIDEKFTDKTEKETQTEEKSSGKPEKIEKNEEKLEKNKEKLEKNERIKEKLEIVEKITEKHLENFDENLNKTPDILTEIKDENPEKTDSFRLKTPESSDLLLRKSSKNPEFLTKLKSAHFKKEISQDIDSSKSLKNRKNSIDLMIEDQYKPELPHALTESINKEVIYSHSKNKQLAGGSESKIQENEAKITRGKSRTAFSKINIENNMMSYEEIDPKSLENLIEKLEIFNEKIKVISGIFSFF